MRPPDWKFERSFDRQPIFYTESKDVPAVLNNFNIDRSLPPADNFTTKVYFQQLPGEIASGLHRTRITGSTDPSLVLRHLWGNWPMTCCQVVDRNFYQILLVTGVIKARTGVIGPIVPVGVKDSRG